MNEKTKVLYINSCVRGAALSRTQKIAEEFLDELQALNPQAEIVEKNLMLMSPLFMNYFNFIQREELISQKKFDHPMFDLAHEFAQADKIVIAAPLWELSFPAVLKVYIENVSVAGINFKYSEQGAIGLCKADKLLYITTRGGDFSKSPLAELEMGASYIQAMCGMYGIKNFSCLAADGLNADGAEPEKIMAEALCKAHALAKTFI